jgi:hypothetical protein
MIKSEELIPVDSQDVFKDSRFLKHDVYAENGKRFFETWKLPYVPPDSTDTYHIVSSGEEGLRGITLLSYNYYNRVDLWWLIAAVNGIFCPTVEMVPGMELRIPSLARAVSFTL